MVIDNHKLPDSVSVLGTEYRIFYETKESNPKMEGSKGYTELCAKEIHIDRSYFEGPKNDPNQNLILKDLYIEGIKVIRHELVHAFILESGLNECCAWAEDEELVDWIARQFPKMLDAFTKAGVAK